MVDFRHETDRLILRDWREGDWAEFWQATNTVAVMEWLGGVLDEDGMAGARARLESYQAEHGHTFWVVERKSDGMLLGFCGLKRSNQAGGPMDMMEVGWRLREEAWGHGYAKEAAIASLDAAFAKFGADDVIALTVDANTPSWGLMIRLGMRRREDLDFANDEFDADAGKIIVYSIDKSSWESTQL
ncbi:MAG: GNAT family N-acetyltransferase [Erythrobacter sp.]